MPTTNTGILTKSSMRCSTQTNKQTHAYVTFCARYRLVNTFFGWSNAREILVHNLSHVNSLYAHEWEKMWQWALFTSSNSEGRHKYEHTCTKRPTIKMTMWLLECELMYSLSVFTSRHPTIQTYFTQTNFKWSGSCDSCRKNWLPTICWWTFVYIWLFFAIFQGHYLLYLLPKSWHNTAGSMVTVQIFTKCSFFFLAPSENQQALKININKWIRIRCLLVFHFLSKVFFEFHLPYDFRDFLPKKINEVKMNSFLYISNSVYFLWKYVSPFLRIGHQFAFMFF